MPDQVGHDERQGKPIMLTQYLNKLITKQNLTADEIFDAVKALQANMLAVNIDTPVLDIVGTGGDKANTVNISTGASLLAASCGVKIAKHGNRSISSQCGSADVLEALDIPITMTPQQVADSINQTGFGFCFAPIFHPAFAKFKAIRRELGVPTCFNLLGPLLNPAQAEYLMIGVFAENLLDLMADVLVKLNIKHALVFHGSGLDELSCIGPVKVIEVKAQQKHSFVLDPQQLGFAKCSLQDLQGGAPQQNAELLKQALQEGTGSIADTLILNAAVAIYIYGQAPSIEAAIPIVKASIKNGKVTKILKQNFLTKIMQQKKQEVAVLKKNNIVGANNYSPINKKSFKGLFRFEYSRHPRAGGDPEISLKSMGSRVRENDKQCKNPNRNNPFKDVLLNDGLSVIAEIKRKSPSKGTIAKIENPVDLAQKYVTGGAAATSVLTDQKFFGGSLADLEKVAKNTACPVLRKDFIIDPLQIAEAATAGADAVLLIVAVLQKKTKSLLAAAKAMNIDALVEVHNKQELDLAIAMGAEIIGINNRDLQTFEVDINRSFELISSIPQNIVKVAESGITSPEIASKLYKAGFDAVLIGETLMRSDDPAAFINQIGVSHVN